MIQIDQDVIIMYVYAPIIALVIFVIIRLFSRMKW